MLKFVAAALAAAVVVTGMPIQSQAGSARGDRGTECRLCKMFTHKRVRATKPAVRRAVRTERRMFAWPKRVRSDSLFKRAPREARPAVRAHKRTERRIFAWPKRVRSESLFKLAPRERRPIVKHTRRAWKPLFATRRAAPVRASTHSRGSTRTRAR